MGDEDELPLLVEEVYTSFHIDGRLICFLSCTSLWDRGYFTFKPMIHSQEASLLTSMEGLEGDKYSLAIDWWRRRWRKRWQRLVAEAEVIWDSARIVADRARLGSGGGFSK